MRSIWKGAISFGLVNIPITLYPATPREELRFHFLRKRDLSPINNKRVAEADGKEVSWDEIARGYEFEKEKFAVLDDEDFARVDVEATQTVDIQEFVEIDEINPMFFSKPYYVEPGKGGGKAYALLREILRGTKKKSALQNLLFLDGENLQPLGFDQRRSRLETLVKNRTPLEMATALAGAPNLLKVVASLGLEGIVAKRRESRYEPGRRTGAWVKIKCVFEQEFVIGGFTAPRGSRSHFGALIVGCYREGKLIFAGKVGTGFDSRMLAKLHQQMIARRIEHCPFEKLPAERGRWHAGFTRAEIARCTWINPELVAQVRFAEWTDDGILRQPAFVGIRDDKSAKEVVRET